MLVVGAEPIEFGVICEAGAAAATSGIDKPEAKFPFEISDN